jgi:AbrB family looped-hinge helix DNA binding protein
MGEPHSVKARTHHGSESLDITIPAEIKREYGISSGDIFIVTAEESDELILKYRQIFSNETE